MLGLEVVIRVLAEHQRRPVALADGLFQMGRDVAHGGRRNGSAPPHGTAAHDAARPDRVLVRHEPP